MSTPRLVPELVSTKANPVCLDAEMVDVAESAEDIQSFCFPGGTSSNSECVASRQGREHQRLVETAGNRTRLTTGCVPITADGRILLISSAKKNQWILPKGGWELDEGIEESAARECMEEAGVSGVLGPALPQVTYERSKARKLRLFEAASVSSVVTPESSDSSATSNAGSTELEYTHIQSTFFPMYVTQVEAHWPESGRLRRLVTLEQGLELLSERPEQQQVLLNVQRQHLTDRQVIAQNTCVLGDER